jgi:hypothetical protein
MDSGAYGTESPAKLRDTVRNYPAIRKDIEFWDDEFNSIPSWRGSDDSVQSKYVPRGILYNHAAGVRTFVWLLTAGVDGNEFDDFGLIHGRRELPDDFTPRPVFQALQNTNALFSDTALDPEIQAEASEIPALRRQASVPFLLYGFRNKNGKAIVAYWMAAHSVPGGVFPPLVTNLTLKNTGIQNPVLIDVVSGEISPLSWKSGTTDALAAVPVRDSVLAIADSTYCDWPVLPQTPSNLQAQRTANGISLRWVLHEEEARASKVIIERRIGSAGKWERIATPDPGSAFNDAGVLAAPIVCYRVRAANNAGESAYSNVVRIQK